ncbi:MAG: hypothetical protein FH749_15485 [Firmicutes bacterium]|nr:hypothetical protein [Bacillota bacterium]
MKKVSMLEVMLLSVTVVISTAVLFMPFLTARAAGQDAWISTIVAGAVACIPAWSAGAVMARFRKKSIIEVLPRLLGTVLGKLFGAVYVIFFLFAAILIFWHLEEFVVGTLMPETPEAAVRLLFLTAAAYGVIKGAVPILHTNFYVMPVGIVVIALVIGLPIAKMDYRFLLPVFEHGPGPMLSGAALLLGWLCQIPLVVFMYQRYVEKKFLPSAGRKALLAVLITSLALLVGALGTLAAFGPRQVAGMYFPSFSVARIISVGAFFEHIEVIFVAVWIAAMYVTAVFYLQAVADGFSDLLSLKNKNWSYLWLFPIVFAWPFFFDLNIDDLVFVLENLAPWVSIVLGGVMPLLLLLRVLLIPEQKQSPEGSDQT